MKRWVQQISNITSHPLFLLFIRIIVGGLFIAFGIVKGIEPKGPFFEAIESYRMLPEVLVPAFAYVVIVAELLFGIGFLIGLFTRPSAVGIAVLLVMFCIALAQAMIRGLYLPDCGCSGSLIKIGETPGSVLVRDIAMLAGVIWFLFVKQMRWTLDHLFDFRADEQLHTAHRGPHSETKTTPLDV